MSETPSPATNFKSQLRRPRRTKPRAYGTSKYGVGKYDDRDDTRYAWTRVKPAISAIIAALLLAAAPAAASNQYCESADALTAVYGFCNPSVDVEGSTAWGTKMNENWTMADTQFNTLNGTTVTLAAVGTSTASLQTQLNSVTTTYLRVDGSNPMNGQLTVKSSGTFQGAGGLGVTYGVTAATISVNSASIPQLTSSMNVAGAGGLGVVYGLSAGTANVAGALTASSGTFTATGDSQASLRTSSGIVVGGTAGITATYLTGKAGTASALAANPTNCASGNYPLGIDASGNVEGCTAGGVGDMVKTAINQMADGATIEFLSGSTFTVNAGSSITINSHITIGAVSTMTASMFQRNICPTGFTEVHSVGRSLGCMQTAEEGSGTYADASNDCFVTYGARLPILTEFCVAFTNFAFTDEGDDSEWTATGLGGANNEILNGASTICKSGTTGDGNSVAYRCFIPK